MKNEENLVTAVNVETSTNHANSLHIPVYTSDQIPYFVAPPSPPTQSGHLGLRYDFNEGCRVFLPEVEGEWRVRMSDFDTGNVLYETHLPKGVVVSAKRYFVRFLVEVWLEGELVLNHHFEAKDQQVLIQLPRGTLGDVIAWFSYVSQFQEQHDCQLTCAMSALIIPLFKDAYPQIDFITYEEVDAGDYYATYRIGLFFDDVSFENQPCDFRQVGLHRTAGYILGVDLAERPPRIMLEDRERTIKERYVCIATQSTSQCKYWNNPYGWREVIEYLKKGGYRVICIDKQAVNGVGVVWNHIPYGAEDYTGDIPLIERAHLLRHADFFIGLASGLSWLAWAVGVRVVMISGFSHPTTEFATPYRVINYHTCNSCWEDVRERFDHKDFLWCPRHANTPRQFECTKLITARQVIATIKKIPGIVVTPIVRRIEEN